MSGEPPDRFVAHGGVGRAELALALSTGLGSDAALSSLLGYGHTEPEPVVVKGTSPVGGVTIPAPDIGLAEATDEARMWFWREKSHEKFEVPTEPAEAKARREQAGKLDFARHVPEAPEGGVETPRWWPWAGIEPALHAALGVKRPGGRVDEGALVRRWAQLRPIEPLPRRSHLTWPDRLEVAVRTDPEAKPFFDEALVLAEQIRSALGPERVRLQLSASSGLSEPGLTLPFALDGAPKGVSLAPEGGRRVGARTMFGPEVASQAERLLVAMAPAVRIDSSVLGRIAFESADLGLDARAVAVAWTHEWLAASDTWSQGWTPEGRAKALAAWATAAKEDADPLLRRALARIREDHSARFVPSLWLEERASAWAHLPEDCALREWLEIQPGDEERSATFFAQVRASADDGRVKDWLQGVCARTPKLGKADCRFKVGAVNPIYEALREAEGHPEVHWVVRQRPDGLRFERRAGHADPFTQLGGERTLNSYGQPLSLSLRSSDGEQLLPTLHEDETRPELEPNTFVERWLEQHGDGDPSQLELVVATELEAWVYEPYARGRWATGLGRDRFGLFAEVRLPDTPPEAWLKMRWIPAGTFLMGSPEDEQGRYGDEGPRHAVCIPEGYWLADAVCTQALWSRVMGENPSEFRSYSEPRWSLGRPVEKVDWGDAGWFVDRLGEMLGDGRRWRLPTEAEWERACRCCTETALYTGALNIRGKRDGPELDAIAWYGGNSGVGFELELGRDSRGWVEKQYPHEKAGTRVVRTKVPNPWGLYDMIGNVLEWCEDDWGEGAFVERRGEVHLDVRPALAERATKRVVRGGSWSGPARYCRSAYRFGFVVSSRYDVLGFRVSRGRAEPVVVRGGDATGVATAVGQATEGVLRSPGDPVVSRIETPSWAGAPARLDGGDR